MAKNVAIWRYDKRKKAPPQVRYRFLSYDECVALGGKWDSHATVLDGEGMLATVKVTSVKYYPRSSRVRIGWKYGLYEYGQEYLTPTSSQAFFVEEE